MSLLDPGFNLTLRPMKYPQFYKMYKDAIANTWSVAELYFAKDIMDLHGDALTPEQKHIVKRLVAFFATGDTIVANNLVLTLYKHLNSPEARMYLGRQLEEEVLHIDLYLTILDNYIPNHEERHEMFRAIETIPSIKAKADFAQKYTDLSDNIDLTDKLNRRKFLLTQMCFSACIEGIFFYAAFAYVYWLRSQGLLNGLADATNWVFRDETCVDSETEVLTPGGWVNITDLTPGMEVAQFDMTTQEVSFVVPSRLVKKHYAGDMVSFVHTKGGIDQFVTADHDVVQKWHYQDTYTKQKAAEFKPNGKKFIPVSGFKKGTLTELSPEDRLRIAIQADGSISNRYDGSRCGTLPVMIGIKKERKKARLREILGLLPYTFTEAVTSRGMTVFRVNVPVDFAPTKDLVWAQSRLTSASSEWCEAFIQEVAEWDGHRPKDARSSTIIYSNNSLASIEVVQQIAVLCGRHATINRNQKEGYDITYRLFIQEKTDASTGTLSRDVVAADTTVYCVTVPTGAFVMRRNEKVSITGNCHMNFGFECIKTIRYEDPYLFDEELEYEVRKMLDEAVACEYMFAEDLFGANEIPGFKLEDMKMYLEFVKRQRLQDLGFNVIWALSDGTPVKQPFPFMELQGMQSLVNFFGRKVADYQIGVTGEVSFEEDF